MSPTPSIDISVHGDQSIATSNLPPVKVSVIENDRIRNASSFLEIFYEN